VSGNTINNLTRKMSKKQLLEKLETALSQVGNNEGALQTVLELHPELIPLPFILNHHHHLNLMFKKFPLPNAQETDFLYLTKSSVEWWVTLMEIESSNKRIFLSRGNGNVLFHSDFNNAYDQILSWKAYIEQNQEPMKQSIMPLLMHMHQNTINYKFVLIIGRNSEIVTQAQKNMFRQKSTNDIRVMTYDSLISFFNYNKIDTKIIGVKSTNAFRILNLNDSDTSMFSHLQSGEVLFGEEIRNQLIAKGYNIPAWEKGELLIVNDKEPRSNMMNVINSIK
jgi:hypothetical protein